MEGRGLLPKNKEEWDKGIKEFQAIERQKFKSIRTQCKTIMKGRNTRTKEEKAQEARDKKELDEEKSRDKLNPEKPIETKMKKRKGLG